MKAMSNIEDLKIVRATLHNLVRIVRDTRQTLAAMLQENEQLGPLLSDQRSSSLTSTLEHLEDVREGFILSQRTASYGSLSELRGLVQHILTDWTWLQDLNLTLTPSEEIETLGQQLIVYNHALVALAVLPRLPAEAITFPQPRPTYGDVTVPALPGELLDRIEELEHMIYQAEIRPISSLSYAPLRRTYAFFEASSWLVDQHLAPLLGD